IRLDPGDDHVERVRAEVDRSPYPTLAAALGAMPIEDRTSIGHARILPDGDSPQSRGKGQSGTSSPAIRDAVAKLRGWPVTVSRKSSRATASISTSVRHVTVAARSTLRSSAISPNESPVVIV